MLNNKRVSRRSFVTGAGLGTGALLYYPLNALGQERGVYLSIEDYNTINAIKASAKQEFSLLCLSSSVDDQIGRSEEVLTSLQNRMDSLIADIEVIDAVEGEDWTRTNFTPAPFDESIPLRDAGDISWILPLSSPHPCLEAVLRVLADVFNIEPRHIDDFKRFLDEQNQLVYVEGLAESIEQNDNSRLRNYVELLINDFTISEAIKQAVEIAHSPIARAIRQWLMKRTIPFIGLCLAIMDVGISLIQHRDEIFNCIASVNN
ncbi:hypothetical protein ACIGG6_03525 [Vreelandella lionensis]|uniref:Twin-arginine translocation signal domain-containing protein n=1 Tax=Vreelandella lionensis TaxID=1144478 RepID=A0ABW8BS39_9GAMM